MKFEKAVIKILEELYKKGDQFTKKDDLEKIRIGRNKLNEVYNYLSHKRLIITEEQGEKWRISPAEGRDYLITYKSQINQEDFNRIIAFTGAILALIGIYTFIKDLGLINETNLWISYVFLIFAIISIGPILKFIIDSYLGG